MSQTRELFCHILIVNLKVSKLWLKKVDYFSTHNIVYLNRYRNHWILFTKKNYLDTGRVIIDHIENVDETEEDGDQETHAASNNLGS